MSDANSGGQQTPGGQQGAVTPEQLTQFEQRIAQMITGAIDSRIGRLGLTQLAEKVEALAGGTQRPSSQDDQQGDKKQTPTESLRREIEALRKQVSERDSLLAQREKQAEVRRMLTTLGVRGGAALDDAVAIIAGRSDLEQTAGGWQMRGRSDLGDEITMPAHQALQQWLSDRQHLLPPAPGTGSGQAGQRGTAAGGGRSQPSIPIHQMTAAQYEALPPAERAALQEQTFSSPKGKGFFGG